MIIRARTIVPMAGDPIENGAVAVEGNRIAALGRFDEIQRQRSGDLVDLGERILLPGLINAHCHLDYTALRGKIGPQESFADWIRAINAEKAKLSEYNYIDSIHAGFAEALRFGTTTVANLTAFPKLIASIKEPVRTWWFGELIDVRNPDQADKIVDEAVEHLSSANRWGLAPHAPFTASPRLYARCEEIARRHHGLLTTHLAESHDEMLMFRDGTGPTFDFLKSFGRPMNDCGRETPVSRFLRTRTMDERWIIAHLNELDAGDFDLLRAAPKFHIAHCPRSHQFFQHAPFALPRLRALGLNVCLGTDSLASNSDLSLFAEMRELLRKHPSVSPKETLQMVTTNGATALGQRDSLGCLTPGACADMIALPVSAAGDIYENIVAFSECAPWTMINGEIRETAA
ncbi:MAG TPA: amidohydrolase family protein [Chthoniobacterales bacterium]|jgi:cytosine/adenosine deaminase-related metal-dependent hydrolase|nr:amidohydrolase family protein [Chthoniobacterales bacterium]